MLEKIREGSQGPIAKIILGAVILSFALTGVYSYLGSNAEQLAAEVNGEEISRYDLDQAFQQEQQRMRAQLGEMFDSLAADANYMSGLRQSVLDRLIAERLLDQKVAEMGLRVSDAQVQQAIVQMPEFQVDGRFDNDRYQAVLRQSGLNGPRLAALLRQDLSRQQLMNGLLGSEFTTAPEVTSLAQLLQQTRDFRYVTVGAEAFRDQVSVDAAEVEAYYNDNPMEFVQPEQIRASYVELSVTDMAGQFDVTDEEAQQYYDAQSVHYTQPERRLAAHMLFEGDDAKARAEAALARVRAGEAFADVAKEASDDSFTAENGGELDWMSPGTMDPQFDTALFGLAQGEVSDVIETDFGFQLVQAKAIAEKTVRPFAEVKAEIVETLKTDKAQREFYALQQTLADVSFEVPDSLVEAAKAVNAEVKETALFSRNTAPTPFDDPRVQSAAFSDSVLLDGMNSDLVEVDNGHVLVLRVEEHIEQGTLPLDQVRGDIEQRLLNEKASALAEEQAEQVLTQWQQGSEPEAVIELDAVPRMGTAELDPALVQHIFKMVPADTGARFETTPLTNGDIAVVALDQVNLPSEVDNAAQLQSQLTQQLSEAGYQALLESLRAEASILYLAGNKQ
ncbi:SurA N-terminal domain-containing protein [Ferrimonas gelatinilytica]|uniref:Periplasmic chaperone PpiD n=1 Tax=Ferrimonas gelatinilytica TaxID=1255257 RepID=A0ABP9S547_9GAMM